MKYSDYIELGFERLDLQDEVEFNETGYTGYILTKNLPGLFSIEVCSGNLDKPTLYITKEDTTHPLSITTEIVKTLCSAEIEVNQYLHGF